MYLINYEEGWEVLSADKRVSQILVMSDKGNIKESDLFNNPAQSFFMEHMCSSILEIIKNNRDYNTPLAEDSWIINENDDNVTKGWSDWYYIGETLWQTVTIGVQDHLLVTEWGQFNPWNTYTPQVGNSSSHCPSGCVMVAWAQMLYYLHYFWNDPMETYGTVTTTASIPSGSTSYVVLDSLNTQFSNKGNYWDQMPLKAYASSGNDSYLAALLAWLGYKAGAHYYISMTTANPALLWLPMAAEFNYSSSYSEINIFGTIEYQILQRDMPCLLCITDDSGQVSHEVVVDGFKSLLDVYHKRWIRYNEYGAHEFREEQGRLVSRKYVAINWGYYGDYDSNSGGDTIWYNIGESWNGYTTAANVIYGFTK